MYLNPGNLEPVYEKLEQNKIDFPILPSLKERKVQGLMMQIDSSTPWKAKVILNHEHTGYLIYYFFERKKEKDACWRLVNMKDYST